MMMPAVTLKDIPGKSVKPILYAIYNVHLLDYNKKTTFIEHHQNEQHPWPFFQHKPVLQTGEVAVAICQKGKNF